MGVLDSLKETDLDLKTLERLTDIWIKWQRWVLRQWSTVRYCPRKWIIIGREAGRSEILVIALVASIHPSICLSMCVSAFLSLEQKVTINQRWKFLSPGRPRWYGLGLDDLFSEVDSLGGRPEMAISQLLGLQTSMTTQPAVQRGVWTHLKHNILGFPTHCPIKLSFCIHQGYLSLLRATWFSSQVALRITTRL